MPYDWKMELYWRMPVWVQEATLSLYTRKLDALYYGPEYERKKQWFLDAKSWSLDQIASWQQERLKTIIAIAAQKVPFYKREWQNRQWQKVHSATDLAMLPILDKHRIRQHETDFITEGVHSKSLWPLKTSGTTGTSLKFYWPMQMVPEWWAVYEVMCRYVAGVAQEIPRAMMGGRPILPGNTKKPPYWRYNRRWKQLYFSSYHVSRQTAPLYIQALRKYGSRWLTGYGSAIAALAENALAAGEAPCPLQAVIVSGDTLSAGMRESIEKYFQCKCFDHYGQGEGVAMAMECPHGRLHITPYVGIIEILRDDDTPCVPGEVGRIVATGLLNDVMPLIRYDIGDYAAWAQDQSCPCGNPHPVITNLIGRTDDYLITADGRKIGRLSTAMKRSPSIHSAQIVQDRPGHAYLLIRPGSGYVPEHAAAVCADIRERIGTFELTIVTVPEIPKTPRGKSVLVVRLDDKPALRETYGQLFRQSQ